MKDNPRYTIAIPAFKGAYLKACIDSVLGQTVHDYELIIVNDASPDPIDDIVNSFSDDRIKYYKNDRNYGAEHMVDNWNRCLELAKGTYFILLGDDDLLEPNYLNVFDLLIEAYPDLDVFHCRAKIINETNELIGITAPCPIFETVYDNMYYRLNLTRDQYISDFVYKSNALRSVGGFVKLPLGWGSDDITSFIICGKKGIAYAHQAVFCYRQSRLTISNSGNISLKMKAIKEQEVWFNNWLKHKPVDPLEMVTYTKLLTSLPSFIKRKKLVLVHADFLKNASVRRLYYWFKNRGHYQISFYDILRIYFSVKRLM